MNSNITLLSIFRLNHIAISRNLFNISDEESLITPEHGGNCINWIFGHILLTRDAIHNALNIKNFSLEYLQEVYKKSPVFDNEKAYPVSALLKLFESSQEL